MFEETPANQRNSGSYPAHGFTPSTGNRPQAGNVTVTSRSLRFRLDSGEVEFPFEGLLVRRGGHNREEIFFEHPAFPGWSIYTSSNDILADPQLVANFSGKADLKKLQKQPSITPLIAIASTLLLLVVVSVLLFVSQRQRIVRSLAAQIPISWETDLGNKMYEQIASEGAVVDAPHLIAQLGVVTNRLLPIVADSDYDFQFHLLENTNINAFAMPGGHIVVYSGLLKAVDTPEELAGVLAHEMAHVTQRHVVRKVIDSAGLYLIVQSLLGDVSGLMALIANSSEFLLRQKYSRDFEREADDVGWEYLLKANIDPRGMIQFFKTLQATQEASSTRQLSENLDFVSTHPPTQERIQRLEAKWAEADRSSEFLKLPTSVAPVQQGDKLRR